MGYFSYIKCLVICTLTIPQLEMFEFELGETTSNPNQSNTSTPLGGHCGGEEYECTSGQCIPGIWFCDQVVDCFDGSDETGLAGCGGGGAESCTTEQYECVSGQCIPGEWICDDIVDCTDSSDESSDAGCDASATSSATQTNTGTLITTTVPTIQDVSACMFENVQNKGNNLTVGGNVTETECYHKCYNDSLCMGATFDRNGDLCWHHSAVEMELLFVSFEHNTYIKNCSRPIVQKDNPCKFENFFFDGTSLRVTSNIDETECFDICALDKPCRGATYSILYRYCWHHDHVENANVHFYEEYNLYVKNCGEDNTGSSCELEDKTHSGSNLRSGFSANKTECFKACEQTWFCIGATMTGLGYCWLHNAIANESIYSHAGNVLYIKHCTDVDHKEDLSTSSSVITTYSVTPPHKPLPATTKDVFKCVFENVQNQGDNVTIGDDVTELECIHKCHQDNLCMGATLSLNGNLCWHHSAVEMELLYFSVDYNIYIKNCSRPIVKEDSSCKFDNFFHSGNELRIGRGSNQTECYDTCALDKTCKGATYSPYYGFCWHHYRVENANVYFHSDYNLYVKDCSEGKKGFSCEHEDKVHSGSALKDTFVANRTECFETCEQTMHCMGATLYSNGNCLLHNVIADDKISSHAGYVLYIKNCTNFGYQEGSSRTSTMTTTADAIVSSHMPTPTTPTDATGTGTLTTTTEPPDSTGETTVHSGKDDIFYVRASVFLFATLVYYAAQQLTLQAEN